jgi:release factor glutamine methyltransferase
MNKESSLNKYSYRDCWDYALSLGEKVEVKEIKNDIIALCGTVPENFWLNFSNQSLSTTDYYRICRNLSRHIKEKCPVPYLTNQVYFYGLNFYVKKGVFIPQPDTEILVEMVLKLANKYWKEKKQLKVLDIGTGCGNIVISLAKSRPDWKFTTVDISPQALTVAKKNSETHQVKNIGFIRSNLFSQLSQDNKFDLIVSNPPYVSTKEYQNLSPTVKAQPIEALIAEDEGYFFYQKIFQQARNFLAEKFLLVVEIGHQQAEKVIKLIIEHFSQVKVSIFFDYAGHSRVIAIKSDYE